MANTHSEQASYSTLLVTIEEHIAVVTLNRPEARNALNRLAYTELEAIFRDLQKNSDVRCIVLTGTDPAFCSGDDVKELMTGDGDTGKQRLRSVRARYDACGHSHYGLRPANHCGCERCGYWLGYGHVIDGRFSNRLRASAILGDVCQAWPGQ